MTASTAEGRRLVEDRARTRPWKRWGPYLSERQWGTVREDYSADGSAWSYFPHDHARSRAYRWGEDGIAGVSDDQQQLCLALALWNGRDPILKERMFGLTNGEGNHGEDVKPNAGGIRAFYFKDPDGHHLEVIWFPPGKGDPRWAHSRDRLFMGIDHTAIVVSDSERSLRFYRDLLGFRVAGESRNYGTEQEHLNNVEGASLRITALRAPGGPGVEFLEYLNPRDGRPYPTDARANDLLHWQTTLLLGPGEGLGVLASSGVPLVSRAVAKPPDQGIGFSRGVIIRDPDGHAVQLIQR